MVSVQAHITGCFAGKISENDFLFTRIWSKTTRETWQVIIGQSSIVA